MFLSILQWIVIVAGLVLAVWLLKRVARQADVLNKRIDEYHREQEAMQKLREEGLVGPVNPYAEMAELYDEKKDKEPED